MSELFETYEREFCDLSGAITCDLNELQTGGSTKQKTAEIESKLGTLQEALRNMELELASLPAAKKAQLSVRLRNFQANASNLKKEFDKAKTSAGRKELLGGNGSRFISAADEEHRERLQATTDRLSKQSTMLKDAKRLVGEMEDLGEDSKNRLRTQRERLEGTLNTVRETNQEMTRSRKLLSLIHRRSLMNKILIFGVIFVLLLVIFLVIYFKLIAPLFSSSSSSPPPPAPVPPTPITSVTDGADVLPDQSPSPPLDNRRLRSLRAQRRPL